MTYDSNWIDKARRILCVIVNDPITETDARSLIEHLQGVANSSEPFYLLLDIRNFNVQKSISLGAMLQNESLPRQTVALEKSRIAVLGGGLLVKMGLQLMRGMGPIELIRAFDQETEALQWLDEEAHFAGA